MTTTATTPTTTPTRHKHWNLAYRAHCGTSHWPEKRADSHCSEYDSELAADLEKVKAADGDPEQYAERYERLWCAWMGAKSNCISSMITGPSNFPTRRAEKANNREHAAMTALMDFRENYFKRMAKAARKAAAALVDPVEEMAAKIEQAEKMQEAMKAANKVVKSKKTDAEKVAELVAQGWREALAVEMLKPDFCGRTGFATYQLTNNLANIKRMRERLTDLQKKAVATTTEQERPDGIRIVENADADRLQVFFPGKPDPATITLLKHKAFKWSPSNGCWQRQLTDNARHALRQLLNTLPTPE